MKNIIFISQIEDDWVAEREVQYANEEEVLPLDMMDADIDWESSAFASMKRRWDETKKAFVEGEGCCFFFFKKTNLIFF